MALRFRSYQEIRQQWAPMRDSRWPCRLERLAGKYAPLVPVLRELILRRDTPLDTDVKERIAGQLDSAAARFAAIWHGPDPDAADG